MASKLKETLALVAAGKMTAEEAAERLRPGANFEFIQVRTPKGLRDRVNEAARVAGISQNAFCIKAIEAAVEQSAQRARRSTG